VGDVETMEDKERRVAASWNFMVALIGYFAKLLEQ
jgi:hypothetical protein